MADDTPKHIFIFILPRQMVEDFHCVLDLQYRIRSHTPC